MNSADKKLKRVEPIIRARKAQLDRETSLLGDIRRQKVELVSELRKYQQMYVKGVEDLNHIRTSGDLGRAGMIESSVDFAKAQWYDALRKVREVEQREKAQLENVLAAQQELKSIETLGDRFEVASFELEKRQEQKIQDETSIHRFKRQP